jgi:hypothetical protein
VATSKSVGDNVNGPSVIRVPSWIEHPLGRYYMYFAHHKGAYIRLAYADAVTGPWKIYEPGVLRVGATIFSRPRPDPPNESLYTHVASPEVFIEAANRRLVMYVHGTWTDGKRWPIEPEAASKWMRDNGYAQYTQTTLSRDGIHFETRPGIVLKTSYLRVFEWSAMQYGMARLDVLARAKNIEGPFEAGPNPFAGSPDAACAVIGSPGIGPSRASERSVSAISNFFRSMAYLLDQSRCQVPVDRIVIRQQDSQAGRALAGGSQVLIIEVP